MLIQVNTDHNIKSTPELTGQVEAAVLKALEHFGEHITRVVVHLSDENSDQKTGKNDMRCMIEARLAGHQPTVVTEHATTLIEAIDGAAAKMKHAVESLVGRLSAT